MYGTENIVIMPEDGENCNFQSYNICNSFTSNLVCSFKGETKWRGRKIQIVWNRQPGIIKYVIISISSNW
jgi:hypothetical protein